jgi:spore coat protein U-like protein
LNNVSINNNYNTSVQIEIASEYVSYCNMTQGITWISGSISPGVHNDSLPVAPSTSVGGAIYIYPPNGANNNYPYILNYQFANGTNVVIVPEVDLAPSMTVTVTNNTQYNIVLSNVSNLFNNQKVIIAPGESGSINIGNGWLFAVGTVDPFENFPSSNPAPVMCFNQFVMVGSKPAINFINDQDYNTCSQYNYSISVNGINYTGNMGSGLNYNQEQVNYNAYNPSASSSTSSSSTSSSSTSSSTSSSSTTIYGGVKPKIVPY